MTNWTLNRMNIVGPDFEVNRFLRTCIRACNGSDEVTFDFEALRPMPDAIRATGVDRSSEAEKRAREETGYNDILSWSHHNWGTTWNGCDFTQLVNEPSRYSCMFHTAWSYPERIFQELGLRFPLLTIRVFSISEACEFGVVGDIRRGYYTAASVPVTRKLRQLAYDPETEAGFPEICHLPDHLKHLTHYGLEATISGINDAESATKVVNRAWAAAQAHFSDDEQARIEFAEDATGYLQWLDDYDYLDERPTWEDAEQALGCYVESAANLRYLHHQIRCAVDMSLVQAVAERIHPRVADAAAAGPWLDNTEDELREWAPYAFARGWGIELTDLKAMHDCAAAAALVLEQEVLNHIRSSVDGGDGDSELKAA